MAMPLDPRHHSPAYSVPHRSFEGSTYSLNSSHLDFLFLELTISTRRRSYKTFFLEQVYGNRKDNYIVIRGIAEYRDGTKRKDWQAYSALVAAAFMRALVENLD